MRASTLWLALAIALGACSDDSQPPAADLGRREASSEALPPCVEGTKLCATLFQIRDCQGGRWVDFADCTNSKDATGHQCTCSVTMLGVCQFGGKPCP